MTRLKRSLSRLKKSNGDNIYRKEPFTLTRRFLAAKARKTDQVNIFSNLLQIRHAHFTHKGLQERMKGERVNRPYFQGNRVNFRSDIANPVTRILVKWTA